MVDSHLPVLLPEVVSALNVKSDGVYADLTLGRGGHSQAILNKLGPDGRLIGIDRDLSAIAFARTKFANDPRVSIVHSEFAEFSKVVIAQTNQGLVDGILLDLGVSSPQLDERERGFSFQRDGALDMRMDQSKGVTAAQWLAKVSERDLVQVLFDYGEEKFSRRIARAIVEQRETAPIATTLGLARIVAQAMPKIDKHKHPATRTFQAIRIYINSELQQIRDVLPQLINHLSVGGRLAIISFHSLEDRLVKRFLRDLSRPKLPPKNLPVPESAYRVPLTLVSKAIKPSADEVAENARARSAVLRVAERNDLPLSEFAEGAYVH